jgi:hypothetical protein
LETFTQTKEFVDDPGYSKRRLESLSELDSVTIDAPIAELIRGLAQLPYCFTLQSCYGHFLHGDQKDPKNIKPLPVSDSTARVDYRIAYVALCIQDNDMGRALFNELREFTEIDPEYIQFGCAEWFWRTYPNSYALQVEPARFMYQDKCSVDYQEALYIEKIRNAFFNELRVRLRNRLDSHMDGRIQ